LGFEAGAKRKNRQRTVDFNQGLDARLIAAKPQLARLLASICVSPIRLAFDFIGIRAAYERGIQCILLATRGLVGPNPDFIRGAFGETFEEFLEILSMPDRYIIYRKHYENDGAAAWRDEFRRLSGAQKEQLLAWLQTLNANPPQRPELLSHVECPLRSIMEHYYPGGKIAPKTPEDDTLAQQGFSLDYESEPE
jgi:hypothetical protein